MPISHEKSFDVPAVPVAVLGGEHRLNGCAVAITRSRGFGELPAGEENTKGNYQCQPDCLEESSPLLVELQTRAYGRTLAFGKSSVSKGQESVEIADVLAGRRLTEKISSEKAKASDAARQMRGLGAIRGDAGLNPKEARCCGRHYSPSASITFSAVSVPEKFC